jgi:acyl-CoA dehydrogenase
MCNSRKKQDELVNSVKQFAKSNILPCRHKLITSKVFPAELWSAFAKSGLAGLSVPEQYGGQDATYETLSKAAYILNLYGGVPGVTMTFLAHWQLTKLHIVGDASPELREKLLPLLVNGETTISVAISEPKAGAHPKHLRTSAQLEENHYILNGEKAFLTNGPLAQYFVVLAVTGNDNDRSKFSAIIVNAENPGLKRTEGVKIDFLHPCPHGGITLLNCKVPVENLIGVQGEAFTRTSLRMRAIEDAVGASSHIGALKCLLNDILKSIPEGLAEQVGKIVTQFYALDIVASELARRADDFKHDIESLLHLQLGFRQQLSACGALMDELIEKIDLQDKPEIRLLHRDISKLHSIANSAHTARLVKLGRTKISTTSDHDNG